MVEKVDEHLVEDAEDEDHEERKEVLQRVVVLARVHDVVGADDEEVAEEVSLVVFVVVEARK